MVLNSFAGHPSSGLYWVGTRDQITARAERARAAGTKALVPTID